MAPYIRYIYLFIDVVWVNIYSNIPNFNMKEA